MVRKFASEAQLTFETMQDDVEADLLNRYSTSANDDGEIDDSGLFCGHYEDYLELAIGHHKEGSDPESYVYGIKDNELRVLPVTIALRLAKRAFLKRARTWRQLRGWLDPEDYKNVCRYVRDGEQERALEHDEDDPPIGAFFKKDGTLRKTPVLDMPFDRERVLDSDFYMDNLFNDVGEWMSVSLPESLIALGQMECTDSPSGRDRVSFSVEDEQALQGCCSKQELKLVRDDFLMKAITS